MTSVQIGVNIDSHICGHAKNNVCLKLLARNICASPMPRVALISRGRCIAESGHRARLRSEVACLAVLLEHGWEAAVGRLGLQAGQSAGSWHELLQREPGVFLQAAGERRLPRERPAARQSLL